MREPKMLAEYIVKKAIDAAVDVLKHLLERALEKRNAEVLEKKQHENDQKPPIERLGTVTLTPNEILKGEVSVASSEAYEVLRAHVDSVRQWSTTVGFADLRGTKALSDIFV